MSGSHVSSVPDCFSILNTEAAFLSELLLGLLILCQNEECLSWGEGNEW